MSNLATLIAALILWSPTLLRSVDLAGAASPAELGTRYVEALARKDVTLYALLVCWERVLPVDRKSLESGFAAEAGTAATDLRFLTLEQMDQELRKAGGMPATRTPVKRGALTYDFNLPIVGYLVYNHRGRDGKIQGSGAAPVGMKGGRYFFITRAPVP